MLTCCVMLNLHDSQSSLSRDEAHRGSEFLAVSLFLKPQFRIGVTPISGELRVMVELKPAEPRSRHLARH